LNLRNQRRLASEILKVGRNRVWIDPEEAEKASSAITRGDVRRLIHEGVIRAMPELGTSQGRKRVLRHKRILGRRTGPGGKKGLRTSGETWVTRIRSIRRRLRELRDTRMIEQSSYRRLSLMAKGGTFRSARHLNEYIEARQLARRR
jgi:large subunit ribosomal protein L19e